MVTVVYSSIRVVSVFVSDIMKKRPTHPTPYNQFNYLTSMYKYDDTYYNYYYYYYCCGT